MRISAAAWRLVDGVPDQHHEVREDVAARRFVDDWRAFPKGGAASPRT
jgi:hypothetical protein